MSVPLLPKLAPWMQMYGLVRAGEQDTWKATYMYGVNSLWSSQFSVLS